MIIHYTITIVTICAEQYVVGLPNLAYSICLQMKINIHWRLCRTFTKLVF